MREGRNGGKLKTGGNNSPGRPRKLPALDVLIAEVMGEEKDGVTAAEAILKKLRQQAASGNIKAAEMLLDRAYGKPKQHIETKDVSTEPTETLTPETIAKIEALLNAKG